MKKFWMALQFLTILPIKIKGPYRQEDFKSVFAFFPAAGACIGLIPAGLVFCAGVWPHPAVVALALAIYTVMTGALHIDGLADTCDGLLNGKPKDQMLEIMRDSRIGTYGAVAVCLVLLLKFAFLSGLSQDWLWKIFILMPMFARWVQSVACLACDYARDDGKAGLFFKYATMKDVIIGGVFSLVIFWTLLGVKGLLIFGGALLPVAIVIKFVESKINGMTGDTVGATSEIAELSILFLAVILTCIG